MSSLLWLFGAAVVIMVLAAAGLTTLLVSFNSVFVRIFNDLDEMAKGYGEE